MTHPVPQWKASPSPPTQALLQLSIRTIECRHWLHVVTLLRHNSVTVKYLKWPIKTVTSRPGSRNRLVSVSRQQSNAKTNLLVSIQTQVMEANPTGPFHSPVWLSRRVQELLDWVDHLNSGNFTPLMALTRDRQRPSHPGVQFLTQKAWLPRTTPTPPRSKQGAPQPV